MKASTAGPSRSGRTGTAAPSRARCSTDARRLDDHHATGVVHRERHGREERQGQEAVHGAELRRKAVERHDPDDVVSPGRAAERERRRGRERHRDLLTRHPAPRERRAAAAAADRGAEAFGEQRQADAGVEDEARRPLADQHGHRHEVVDPVERRGGHAADRTCVFPWRPRSGWEAARYGGWRGRRSPNCPQGHPGVPGVTLSTEV